MTEVNSGWLSRGSSGHTEVLEHYPYALRSGWLPRTQEPLRRYHQLIREAKRTAYKNSVAELDKYLDSDPVVRYFVDSACQQNLNLVEGCPLSQTGGVPIPRIEDKETLLHGFNEIMNHPPRFVADELVGLPFSAWIVGIDPTLSGVALLGLPTFNQRMSAVLREWFEFLATPASAVGFSREGEQWLSPAAKKQYQFDDWRKDQDTLPYWTSWNSFFTRQFKDASLQRPIADPTSNRTAIAANDGSLYRWQADIATRDVFWFKDMRFSLADILSSPIPEQQQAIDDFRLVEMFSGGSIFQTYLNPYNFHRWWVPVNGTVLFDPFVVPGDFFNKLVIPDFGGATTASLPYLAEVNARGIIVFKTPDFGHVCCIPLGMSEVSTVTFNPAMRKGVQVRKGQEMGMFNYGGSSFVLIYEKLKNKKLIFMDSNGNLSPSNPPVAADSASTGGVVTNIGSKIGQWVDLS